MHEEWFMSKKKRRVFPAEFKADAVKLVQSGRGVPEVARELGLVESTLRYWVSRAEIDAGVGPPGALISSEREELARLRKENKRLQMERDILKAAATFFAKESE
jgi:transposase